MDEANVSLASPLAAFVRDTMFGRAVRSLFHWQTLDYEEEHRRAFAESYYLRKKFPESIRGCRQHVGFDPEDIVRTESLVLKSYNKDDTEYLVDFFDPKDPELPRNWSVPKKTIVTAEICLMTASTYMASSLWSSSIDGSVEALHVSEEISELGTSLFLWGLGIGCIVLGPVSESPSIGKNNVYFPSLILFIVLQLPIVLSYSMPIILIFRFFTGLFASVPAAIGGGSISSMWSARKLGYPMIVYDNATGFGPFLGPVVGNLLAQYGDWTWPIWFSICFSGFALLVTLFFLPETDPEHILYRRAVRLRQLTANQRFATSAEAKARKMTWTDLLKKNAVKPLMLNFQEPIVLILNAYLALNTSLLFAALESYKVVFIDIYGFTSAEEGLTFLAVFVGFQIGMIAYFFFLYFHQEKLFDQNDKMRPEERIVPAFVTAVLLPVALFMYGWTARESVHWIVPTLAGLVLGIANQGAYAAILNYLPDAYPTVASTVLAGNAFMRAISSGMFPLFTTQLYNALGPGWASSIWAIVGVLFAPAPFVLYRYGQKIRMKSKNALKDF